MTETFIRPQRIPNEPTALQCGLTQDEVPEWGHSPSGFIGCLNCGNPKNAHPTKEEIT